MVKKFLNSKSLIIILVVILLILLLLVCTNSTNDEIIENFNYEESIDLPKDETEKESKKIVIHITGCVQKNGIVEVVEGSRIIDVIEEAGGLTNDADISKVNLAYVVKDAQKIYIPSIYDIEEIEYISTENGENVIIDDNMGVKNNMVNINTATQVELEQLPGIGPSTALKIINYRKEKGNFKTIEDIKNVPGIGDSKFINIKDMIEI